MSTVIKVNPEIFSEEVTAVFLKDHELACQTMDHDTFLELYLKHDLTILEDHQETITDILEIMKGWKKDALTTIESVTEFDSNCLFCNIGKSVKVYQFTVGQKISSNNDAKIIRCYKIGFRFEFKNNRLIEYGHCNAFRDNSDSEEE